MNIKTINGSNYSLAPFDGFTHIAKVAIYQRHNRFHVQSVGVVFTDQPIESRLEEDLLSDGDGNNDLELFSFDALPEAGSDFSDLTNPSQW